MQVFAKVTGLHQLELKVIVSIFMGCWELNSGSLGHKKEADLFSSDTDLVNWT